MDKKLLFNPSGDDTEKRLIRGNTTNVFDLYNIKYKWAKKSFDDMMANHWIPEKASMVGDKQSFTELTDIEREAYLKILSFLIFLDSIQTNNIPNIADYITAPEVVLALSRQQMEECLTGDTKVLHESKGWIDICDLEVGDRIFSCNQNLEGKFSEVEKMNSYTYSGDMYEINGSHISKKVTPNHRILYKDRRGKNCVINAKDMCDCSEYNGEKVFYKGSIPNSVYSFINVDGDYNLDYFSKFLIALQADGNILKRENQNNYEMSFMFKKERKIKRFEEIVRNSEIFYTKRLDKKTGKTIFYTKIPKERGLISKNFEDVFDLKTFSQNKAKEFIEELFKWDGWDYDKAVKGYDTTSKENAYFAMKVCVLAGYKCKIFIKKDNRKESYKDLYRLYINTNCKYSSRGSIKIKKVKYNGEVYCPSVDGSFFICMRDGKIFITGNSIHSKSYGHIMTSIFDKETAMKAIYYWRDDKILLERNSYIAKIYQDFSDNPTDENFVKVLIANYLLEGLYFYNGFYFFYNLASRGLMTETAVQIKYINRDELQHCALFVNVINTLREEEPELMKKMEDEIYEMFKIAVEQEVKFTLHALGEGILGMNEESVVAYTSYIANRRLKSIKMNEIFPKHKNPYAHLEYMSGVEDETTNKANMFEVQSTAYKQASVLGGWDEL